MSPGDVIDPGAADAQATAIGPNAFRVEVPVASFRTVFLEMVFSPKGPDTVSTGEPLNVLGTGTGFFYRVNGQDFILTARHNVTGHHWETNEFLCQNYSVEPTHLRISLRGAPPPEGYSTTPGSTRLLIPFGQCLIPLIDDEWNPTWLEHPEYGPLIDVAAVKFTNPDPDHLTVVAWEPQEDEGAESKLWVTQDISIAGYPFGLTSGPALPLWIRATVASEPGLTYYHRNRSLPAFLVDARTRKGQSGSPAILFRLPSTPIPSDDGVFRYTLGTHSRLLGVYTGRVHPKESDLGFVWHIKEAEDICRGGVPGDLRRVAFEL
ncbi:trypsin-like peptidase domain-containing protein [Mycobacterium marinum]|uniref:trypsin-like peptidase domain-containing protein n=1 Tax=Mycobacterium marinum TaxID=1781 RepID=UPI00045FD460|nr:trypsin-like peptidase domain-containing protein [Mycobacterium marinum]CDM76138.1 hypothetical protein MMARE11_19910 [Mycobacterium marinum E11]